MNQQQVEQEQERERLRIAISLQFQNQVRGVMATYIDPEGMPPVDDPEYLAELRKAVEGYGRKVALLGGVG